MKKTITTTREYDYKGRLVSEVVVEEVTPDPVVSPVYPGLGQTCPAYPWTINYSHGSHCACGNCVPRVIC